VKFQVLAEVADGDELSGHEQDRHVFCRVYVHVFLLPILCVLNLHFSNSLLLTNYKQLKVKNIITYYSRSIFVSLTYFAPLHLRTIWRYLIGFTYLFTYLLTNLLTYLPFMQVDLEDQLNELRSADENSKRAMSDAARLAEELRREQEHAGQIEKLRRGLEAQVGRLSGAVFVFDKKEECTWV